MVAIAIRDVLWRRRRFLVAIIATSVVLALTLVLDGVDRSFPAEARRTVAALNAEGWIVPQDGGAAFLSSATLPASLAMVAGGMPGAVEAAPIATLRMPSGGAAEGSMTVIGVVPGAFTGPPVVDGRAPAGPREVTVERSTGVALGDVVTFAGHAFTVVGRTSGLTLTAGVPSAYVPLADVQELVFAGQPLASAVVTLGTPVGPPEGYVVLTNAEVRAGLLDPLGDARATISLVLVLLWIVAGMVIGSVIYLTSLDRGRDIAVLKATGATDRSLLIGVVFQSLLVSGLAALAGMGVSLLLDDLIPLRSEVAAASYLTIFLVALAVAAAASTASARRALRVDPAHAFGGA
jgi:putative ABC transport system permease protein